MSSAGFSGASSFLYRIRPSTRVKRIETVTEATGHLADPLTVTNHSIDARRVDAAPDPLGRITLVRNQDFSYGIGAPGPPSDFFRNAYADELWAVVRGNGTLETEFGELDYGPLDFVYIPRGTTWRARPDDGEQRMVIMESPSPIGPPPHYRNQAGQFTSRSIYAERDLRTPQLADAIEADGEFALVVKLGDEYARAILPSHPFDVVGWDGALYPYALSMRSIEPLSGRVHLTPDMHQVFQCEGLMICAITPNRTPDHPASYPAQPDHRTDCDEIFYRFDVAGSTTPGAGTITVHSRALAHGPKPGFEERKLPERTDLWGIILDAVRPVHLTGAAIAASDPDYGQAWL